MNGKKFLKEVVANLDIKKAEEMETFEDGGRITTLYITLEKPLKFSVDRDEGFCLIIADALDISDKALYFVVADYDVLSVNWGSLQNLKWKDCSDEDYLEELKKYEDFDFD